MLGEPTPIWGIVTGGGGEWSKKKIDECIDFIARDAIGIRVEE
jgi:hypothetical protein